MAEIYNITIGSKFLLGKTKIESRKKIGTHENRIYRNYLGQEIAWGNIPGGALRCRSAIAIGRPHTRILGSNSKTNPLARSASSRFSRFIARLRSIFLELNQKMDKDGRKQENTEQVRSPVPKIPPNIRMRNPPTATANPHSNTARVQLSINSTQITIWPYP